MRTSTPPGSDSERRQALYQFSDPALSELSLDEFLDQILERAVSALGVDTASILLLDDRREMLEARASSGVEAEVEQRIRVPLGTGFAGRIAAERVPIAIRDVDGADIINPIIRDVGLRSLLGVPLIVEGEVIGVLHVGALTSRSFSQGDLESLQVVAARVAPGIAHAKLFAELRQEHEITLMLQRSLLPTQLARVEQLQISAGYMAAVSEAGGDWYDAFALGDGQIGITIGDVIGKGIPAATVMGQLRTSLRAYALEGHSPQRTLQLVNGFAHQMSSRPIATAIYGVIDPRTGLTRLASAGHLPPLLLTETTAGSGGEVLRLTPGPPLGAFAELDSPELELTLAPDSSLVLYSDGLVERRGVPLDDSIDGLLGVIVDVHSAADICSMAFHQLTAPEAQRDDAAILALRRVRPR